MDAVGPGSILGDRYVLRQRLAETPDASRWKADDQTLDRVVVVQVLHRGHPHAAAVLDAARRAAGIDDPRLVRVLDVGRDPLAYLVTEWVGDTTLASRLTGGTLPAETVRGLLGEVSLALEHARRRGLHHLQLTPDDIHLADEHAVKVAGLAVHAAMSGDDGSSDAEADAATDTRAILALGYAGLTGYWPLGGRTALPPAPTVAGAPAPPSEIVSGVPADLDTLCAQAFAGAGAPGTPGELAAQIAPWGRGRRPVRTTEPTGPLPTGPLPTPAVTRAPAAGPADDTIVLPTESARASAAGRRPAPPATARPATARDRPTARDQTTAPVPALGRPAAPARATPAARANAAPAATAAPAPRADPPTTRPALTPGTAAAAVRAAATKVTTAPAAAAVKAAATKVTAATAAAVRQPRFVSAVSADSPMVRQATVGPGGLFDDDSLDDGREAPAPLLPPAPMSRPPQNQTRTVLLLVGGVLAVFFLLAFLGLRGLGDNPFVSLPQRTSTPSVAAPEPTASAPATTTGALQPVRIQGATGFDPEGDGTEKDSLAAQAFDDDPGTAWTSENYRTEAFGGLKNGVGLRLDLGSPTAVSRVSVDVGTGTSALQLRTVDGESLDGSQVVAESNQATGTVTLTPKNPVTTRYLVLWFTRPAQTDRGYRVEVREVSVR